MILEPIYEAWFSQRSFSFRHGRNRWNFEGYLWYMSTTMDGMKVEMVIIDLMRDVRDTKVVDLIKSALVTLVITS